MERAEGKVRLDKWLWAARFYRTRAKVKQAIEGGKVAVEGGRAKPSKDVRVGDRLEIRQGWDLKEIVVTALAVERRGAAEASLLYEETAASVARRQREAELRRSAGSQAAPSERPSKRARRQIHRFRDQNRG